MVRLYGPLLVADSPGDYYDEVGEFKQEAQSSKTKCKFNWPFNEVLHANNCPIRRFLSRRAFN
jgi:hypothetical protein